MDVFVVSHTHWDREWYHGAARFRQRLVPLVDELIDAPAPLAPSFLLDGQSIVLEDYLAVRPDRRDALAGAMAAGRLEAGPWYVLADTLLPGAESHVRNLLAGRAILRSLGATAPPVLYSPDSFGHAAAMPRLAQGFGLPVAIVWRGYGGRRWPEGDTAWWEAAGGERVILHHLPPDGYEVGSNLPVDRGEARRRWSALRGVLAPRASLGLLLVPNGADHHALQRDAAAAVDALSAAAAPDDRVRWTSLRDFARTLAGRVSGDGRDGAGADGAGTDGAGTGGADLPTVRGELRDSYGYTWTLQGCFATRAGQKRRAALAERALLRDVEPWVAISALAGDPGTRALVDAAWRTLLRCQPHDTLCGCSIDEVARSMDGRLRSVRDQAAGLRGRAMSALLGHDPVDARERPQAWRPTLVVRNAAPRSRGGVAEVELLAFVEHVPVGPRSAVAAPAPVPAIPAIPSVDGGRVPIQPLRSGLVHDLTESPRNYPDCDLVSRTRALAWLPPQDGYALRTLTLGEPDAGAVPDGPPVPVRGGADPEGARWLDSGQLRVDVSPEGRVTVTSPDGRRIDDLLALEDVPDQGDCYTHSPAGPRTLWPRPRRVRLLAGGPLRAALALDFEITVPTLRMGPQSPPAGYRTAARDAEGAVAGGPACTVTVVLSLDAGSEVLGLTVRGANRAPDHRLRLVVRTDVAGGEIWADAAFGPVRRAPMVVPPEDAAAERPPATAPLHRWVSAYSDTAGATLVSDGLAEYEAGDDGSIAVTLVRAVGQLSRADLPERPGHAGWPAPTPAAQCRGPIRGRFALRLHGPRDVATLALVERTADDTLLPLRGESWRSMTAPPASAGGATLAGQGLAMGAIKPADDAGWRLALRCVNLLDEEVAGSWTLGAPVAEARLARLDETPADALEVDGGTISFTAPARAVVTILVR